MNPPPPAPEMRAQYARPSARAGRDLDLLVHDVSCHTLLSVPTGTQNLVQQREISAKQGFFHPERFLFDLVHGFNRLAIIHLYVARLLLNDRRRRA